MNFTSDIDIDFADRDMLLQHIDVTAASIRKGKEVKKHITGVYPTAVPHDPINDICSLNYVQAEERGYIKLDFLNVYIYKYVKDETHLIELMKEPKWENLLDIDFFSKLIHVGNYYERMMTMPEPIDNIRKMAMFLSLIRPGKKHLFGLPWIEVDKQIWKTDSEGYSFKKSHAVAYAQLVAIHMNLLDQKVNISD
jgi:hypothetical protein